MLDNMTLKVLTNMDTRSDQQKKIDAMKEDLQLLIEHAKITAKVTSEQYKALIAADFTEEQAMRIITTQPSWKTN